MTPLTEHLHDWRAPNVEIDADRRLVRNVALTGLHSKNGYRYTEDALKNAVELYRRKPVFLDHPPTPGKPLERSARDLVGAVVNPRYDDGRIRGDVELLDTDAGRTFLALAQAQHPAVGMSHIVLADRHEDTVDRIHDVISVDAVVFPATTNTLSEQAPSNTIPGPTDPAGQTAHTAAGAAALPPSPPPRGRGAGGEGAQPAPTDTAAPANPACGFAMPFSVSPSLSHSVSPSPDPSVPPSPPAPLSPCPSAPSTLPQHGVEPSSLDARCEARLAHAPPSPVQRAGPFPTPTLPPAAYTPLLLQQLKDAPDDQTRQALLADRRLLLERLTPTHPTSLPRQSPTPTLTDEAILQSLRRR